MSDFAFTKPCENSWCNGTMKWYPDPPDSNNRVFDGQWECDACTRLSGANKPEVSVIVECKELKLAQELLLIATDKLSFIAYCSNACPGDCITESDHRARWMEKTEKAKQALREMEDMNNGVFDIYTGTGVAGCRRGNCSQSREKAVE